MSNPGAETSEPQAPRPYGIRLLSWRHTVRVLWSFVRLGRPHFLLGGLALHILGAEMAWYSGAPVNLPALLWAQIAVTAIQWMTHYSNDYFDRVTDRAQIAPTWWSGGSQVLVRGLIRPATALTAALVLGMVGILASLVLTFSLRRGALPFALLLVTLALSWFYSSPPLRFVSTGMGEVLAALIVAGLVPLIGYSTQAGNLAVRPLVSVTPLLGLQFVMILTVSLPDARADAEGDKRTLAVRLGVPQAIRLTIAAIVASYAVLPLAAALGMPPWAAASVASTAPLAAVHARWLRRGDATLPARGNRVTTMAVALVSLAIVAEIVAFATQSPQLWAS